MRGTRIDTHHSHPQEVKEGRYRVVHFGDFQTGMESKELDISEKDLTNLFHQIKRYVWKEPHDVEEYYKEEEDGE